MLVGRLGQPHDTAVHKAGTDCSKNGDSHLLIVLGVEHWALSGGPALGFHLHRRVSSLVHPDELMRFCYHQVTNKATEGGSFGHYSQRLVNELSVYGLASANFDPVCSVKLPKSVA